MVDRSPDAKDRLIAYIDGFNLYHGIKQQGWHRYLWLDLSELVQNLLPQRTELATVNYFTSRISGPRNKRYRQTTYIEALEQRANIRIHYGQFLYEDYVCPHCLVRDRVPSEKMTDVNIAVEMMADAHDDRFDVAMLISGDSDLVPPVAAIRRLYPEKRVVIAFPPKRHNSSLEPPISSHAFIIHRKKLADSQLPEEPTRTDGFLLRRPSKWT